MNRIVLCSALLFTSGCQSPLAVPVMQTPPAAQTARIAPSAEDPYGAAPSGPNMTASKVAAWKEERALFQEVKNLYGLGRYQEARTKADLFLSRFPRAEKQGWVVRLKRKAMQKLAAGPTNGHRS